MRRRRLSRLPASAAALAAWLALIAPGCGPAPRASADVPVPEATSDATADAIAPDPQACRDAGTRGATARCLAPSRSPQHYVAAGLAYFDTLDVSADPASAPAYAPQVARWEWPPWLKLTGWGREHLVGTASLLKQVDPCTVPARECRAFDVQPFCRCVVAFAYDEGPCPIYEEFTFNAAGEITFIEAWSDLPGLVPGDPSADRWGEAPAFPRLATRVPGLGTPDGRVDPNGAWMHAAEATDPDVADFATRARDPWATWAAELKAAGDDLYARGCGWTDARP